MKAIPQIQIKSLLMVLLAGLILMSVILNSCQSEPAVQTVEVTRIVQETVVVVQTQIVEVVVTATPEPATPSPAVPPTTALPTSTPWTLFDVEDSKVIYYGAKSQRDGAGYYTSGVVPWMDLLVKMDGQWYGPERFNDEIEALPLPFGYRWEYRGGFDGEPNGEAWWMELVNEGYARLLAPDNTLHLEVPLKVYFRSGGG